MPSLRSSLLLLFSVCVAAAIAGAPVQPLPADLQALALRLRNELPTNDTAKARLLLDEVVTKLSNVPQVAQFMSTWDELMHKAKTVDVNKMLDPDVFRTLCEVAVDKGFACEAHTVATNDGYLIETFRIYRGSPIGKRPVLLSHGLLDTAFSWILNSPTDSLGYILAANGYDVWLGNVRGNVYGIGHTRYGQFDKELWDFSFDQQAIHDVPSTINYILNRTSERKVAVIGHSQGCGQLFAAVQHDKTVADDIAVFVALAPAGYFDHLTNLLVKLAANFYLADLLEIVGVDKFLYLADAIEDSIPFVCDLFPNTVEFLLSLVMGSNPGEVNLDRLEVACKQSLGWTSVHNMVHWSQLIRDDTFQMFDWGYWGNRDAYGNAGKPPKYDIARNWPQAVPVAVFYGGNDDLVPAGDAEQIIKDLGRAAVFTKRIEAYAHLDFTWGKTAYLQIYNETLSILRTYHA